MNVVLAAKSRESEEANLSNSTRKAAKRSNSPTTSMGNGCVRRENADCREGGMRRKLKKKQMGVKQFVKMTSDSGAST